MVLPDAVAAVVIVALLMRSAPSRSLNAGRGKSSRSRAMCSSSASSGSGDDGPAPASARIGCARIASRASASRSIRASSLMDISHPGAQGLQRAKLQLLHGALRSRQIAGDFADALVVNEALDDDAPLVRGQAAHEVRQHGTAVHLGGDPVLRELRRRLAWMLPGLALPSIGQGVPGDPQEPRDEGDAAPLERREIGQGVVEDLCGTVLSLAPALGAARD